MASLVRATRALTTRARRARRVAQAGFTLVELMVVVILVAILSMLAVPALQRSRNDQIAFDYARKIQLLFNRARTRANAGNAQLLVADFTGRGKFQLFEAIDSTSCTLPNEFSEVPGWPAGQMATAKLRFIDGEDLNNPTSGIVITDDIKTYQAPASPALAYCVTPSGRVIVGKGAGVAAAVTDMQAMTSQATWTFTDTIDVRVSRLADLTLRSVILSGGSSARILTRK